MKRLAITSVTAAAVIASGAAFAGPASADTAQQVPGSNTPYWPVLKQGQTSEQVRTLQWLLNCKGIKVGTPSHFGPNTYKAVRTYQSSHGLNPDGNVGAYTWTDLANRSQVNYDNRNDCVKALQVALNHYRDVTGASDLPITGYYGPKTRTALNKFQHTYGLPTQNLVDVKTWNRLTGPIEAGE